MYHLLQALHRPQDPGLPSQFLLQLPGQTEADPADQWPEDHLPSLQAGDAAA